MIRLFDLPQQASAIPLSLYRKITPDNPRARVTFYAALALLSVTLLKLFFHDLDRLEALYRIGALFAVAVIAILASFAYQRFQPSNEKTPPPLP